MTTRKLKGTLYGQDGSLQLGKRITVTLVDLDQRPTSGWDISVPGAERRTVPLRQTTATDLTTGYFELDLVPNDIIAPATRYLVEVGVPNTQPIVAALISGEADCDWYDFYTQGTPLTTAEVSAFLTHVNDAQIHQKIIDLQEATSLDGTELVAVLKGMSLRSASINQIVQFERRSGVSTPVGSIIPLFVGEEYLETETPKWYKSTGLTNVDWVALN